MQAQEGVYLDAQEGLPMIGGKWVVLAVGADRCHRYALANNGRQVPTDYLPWVVWHRESRFASCSRAQGLQRAPGNIAAAAAAFASYWCFLVTSYRRFLVPHFAEALGFK